MGNWFELGYTEMPDSDPETFTVLSRDFGKDKHAVYRKGEVQKVDYATFVIDEHGIAKDAFHVYYDTYYSSKGLIVITGADPKTYKPYTLPDETYNQRWGRDHQSVFLYGKKVDVDGKTFVRINQTLAVDSLAVYAVVTDYNTGSGMAEDNTRVVRVGDNSGGTYKAINEHYARFGNTIAISNWKTDFTTVSFEKIDTIKIVDERNLVVNNVVVSDGKRLDGVDAASLDIVGRDHLKDKTSVYFDGQKLPGADPETFTLIDEYHSKDKQRVFFKAQLLPNLNAQKATMNFATNTISDGVLSFKEGVLVE